MTHCACAAPISAVVRVRLPTTGQQHSAVFGTTRTTAEMLPRDEPCCFTVRRRGSQPRQVRVSQGEAHHQRRAARRGFVPVSLGACTTVVSHCHPRHALFIVVCAERRRSSPTNPLVDHPFIILYGQHLLRRRRRHSSVFDARQHPATQRLVSTRRPTLSATPRADADPDNLRSSRP